MTALTIDEAMGNFYEIARKFFPGDKVFYAEQKMVKPPVPYITIKAMSPSRDENPIKEDVEIGETSYRANAWRMSFIVELNIYTKGKLIGGDTYKNTCLSDVYEFIDFLESEEIVDELCGMDMTVLPILSSVKDLSFLIADTRYRYRSFAEFVISFTHVSAGGYGQANVNNVPNSSGGNSEEIKNEPSYIIENVEVKEEKEHE